MSTDMELLRSLQNQLGLKLKPVPSEKLFSSDAEKSYAVDETNRIIGLNLNGLALNCVPDAVTGFGHLEKLSLASNRLTVLPSSIDRLKKLLVLDLGHNLLTDLPPAFGELRNLQSLDLEHNRLSRLPAFISNFKKLEGFYVRGNGLTKIPLEIAGLSSLKYLWLSNNLLESVPPEICKLKGLKELWLRDNRLTRLPVEITRLGIEIRWNFDNKGGIILEGNPLESPPVELVKQGRKAVETYFNSLKEEKRPINEVKVLLVGDGGAGKTSLLKQLMGQHFDIAEPQTHGINIEDVNVTAGNKKIKIHLWDFGGQEIMHASHQFFLSKRSLYILVLDGRKDEKTEYWLKHIESFGGDSPVLIVVNKTDLNSSYDVNRKFLKTKYESIKGFYRLSCKTKDGVLSFKQSLIQELTRVKHLQTTWPKAWFNVKRKLEETARDFIRYENFTTICHQHKIVDEESIKTLIGFLNDLGVVLYFKDFALQHTGVLNPRWVTEAVYKIVNSNLLASGKGILELKSLHRILPAGSYPGDKHNYIISLMKKFELCYSLAGDRVLIPDLLGVEETAFDFDVQNALKFRLEYDFLPKSVMPRFIVKMHNEIENEQQWRTGVVLNSGVYRSRALVRADEEARKIFIYVTGELKRDFFAVIRHAFKEINDSFEKLIVNEMVPLPDNEHIAVEYEELIGFEIAGKNEIFIGKLRKGYGIKALLAGIETPEERMNATREDSRPIVNNYLIQRQNVEQAVAQLQENVQNTCIHLDIAFDLPELQNAFAELKELVVKECPTLKQNLDEIGDCLDDIGPDSRKEQFNKPFNKLSRFMKKLADENSTLNKVIANTGKGIRLAQKIGALYNKFAQLLPIPKVPEFLLEQDKR